MVTFAASVAECLSTRQAVCRHAIRIDSPMVSGTKMK